MHTSLIFHAKVPLHCNFFFNFFFFLRIKKLLYFLVFPYILYSVHCVQIFFMSSSKKNSALFFSFFHMTSLIFFSVLLIVIQRHSCLFSISFTAYNYSEIYKYIISFSCLSVFFPLFFLAIWLMTLKIHSYTAVSFCSTHYILCSNKNDITLLKHLFLPCKTQNCIAGVIRTISHCETLYIYIFVQALPKAIPVYICRHLWK